MSEIWETIENYENYQVSNFGRVKSLNYLHTKREKVLKPIIHKGGYLSVILYKNGKQKYFLIHRLIAQAFIGDIDGMAVHHIDENPKNNKLENLKIETLFEHNSHHQLGKKLSEETKKKMSVSHLGKQSSEKTKKKMSLARRGEKHPGAILNESFVKNIRELFLLKYSNSEIGKLFGVSRHVINQIKTGKSWKGVE